MTCWHSQWHDGDYAEGEVVCSECGQAFDHRAETGEGGTYSHRCGVWVELWPGRLAHCALPTHNGECIGEVVTRDSFKNDYNKISTRKPMRIYTDGGYRERVGSWAWVDPVSGRNDSGVFAEETTNQRMELTAAWEAMDTFLDEPNLVIVSDSAYLVNTMENGWYKKWLENGWVNSKGEAVANQDLWQHLIKLVEKNPDARFEKVKGHSGDPGNEEADRLATKALTEYFAQREAAHVKRDGENPFNKVPPAPYKLKPHQAEVIPKIKNGSVLNGDVGTGKTFTALAYFVLTVCMGLLDRSKPMGNPKKLIVITTAKKRDEMDWESEAMHLGLFTDPELSYSGKELVVDSWNNMHKYVDEVDAFFIFDEQRLVGSGAWVKAFLKIVKQNRWILLSATPADNWIDYLPLFLAHGFFKNKTEFMDNHVVWKMVNGRYPKIKGYYGVSKLRQLRDSILVEMPYDRHTVRHLVAIEVDHDVGTFKKVWQDRWNVFEDAPLIDSGEMHRVGRRLVNSDLDRLRKIEELGVKNPRMIIFYNFDYELEMLRTLHTSMDIKVAEWNGHRHEPVPDDDRWLYLVQYQAGAEGWNCTTTDCIVFYSLTYSHKIFEQSQGRIDRLDTPFVDLWYYILMSQAKIDKLIWKSLVSKKNFHEGRKVRFNRKAA